MMKKRVFVAFAAFLCAYAMAARPRATPDSACVDDCAVSANNVYEFLECVDVECTPTHFFVWPGPVPIPIQCFGVTVERQSGMSYSEYIDKCAVLTFELGDFVDCLGEAPFTICR